MTSLTVDYRGRFAPSPTGLLHAGSLVAALASWLDARAHGGTWLVRIEDHDLGRCVPGAGEQILAQLACLGLIPDETPVWQSSRGARYEQALGRMMASNWVYPCACSRREILQVLEARGESPGRNAELVYPGTCRNGIPAEKNMRPRRAWRLRSSTDLAGQHALVLNWVDRRLGMQSQDLTHAVGDFVLRRADGLWAYQLAVVVDDAEQGITHVVRGEDLADNTPRQIRLQQLLGLPTPSYLHTPLVLGPNGEKLSKQNGAMPLDLSQPLATFKTAAQALGLNLHATTLDDARAQACAMWASAPISGMMPA